MSKAKKRRILWLVGFPPWTAFASGALAPLFRNNPAVEAVIGLVAGLVVGAVILAIVEAP